MKLMSCDQSYSNFAIVVFEDNAVVDWIVLHTGETVKQNEDKLFGKYFATPQEQLQYLYAEFKNFFIKHMPDFLVFEGLAFGAKGNRVFNLGGLFFHITTSLIEDDLLKIDQLRTVTPQAVKKIARESLNEEDQFEKDKAGNILFNKNGKPKMNTMSNKKWIVKALQCTGDGHILEGYTVSSKKIETGKEDLPDAYFIGAAALATMRDYEKKSSDKSPKKKGKI